jgi:hypothetical protein
MNALHSESRRDKGAPISSLRIHLKELGLTYFLSGSQKLCKPRFEYVCSYAGTCNGDSGRSDL